MGDARPLMHTVAGRNQGLLVFIHETRPTLRHDDNLELGDMLMPASPFRGRKIGSDEMGDHFAVGRFGDSEIAIKKEWPKSVAAKLRVSGFDMRELRSAFYLRRTSFDRCRMCFSHRKPP